MKKSFLLGGSLFTLFLFFTAANSFGQTIIWSDNFNNGCASNCIASTWNGWTILDNDGGTTGGAPNDWFVSCAEEGIVPPGCGSSCIGDASLHIGANPGAGGDMGASYNETGANNATFRTAVSPTVSTVTYLGVITLSFDFIAFGSAACSDDRLQLRLSSDNGATWPAGYQYCLNSPCCGACNGYSQGQWTTYNLALPAAFSNNPNVRVAFNWMNNGNGSGTDPSGAVDDVRFTTPIALSVDLLNFSAEKSTSGTNVSWNVENERSFSRYELERSYEGDEFSFIKIHTVNGNCSGNDPCTYSYKDISHNKTVYYRLKMIDENGDFSYSSIISLDESAENSNTFTLISDYVENDLLQVKLSSKKKSSAKFVLYNIAGKAVITENDVPIKSGFNQKNLDINKLSNGVYILKIYFENEDKVLSAKVIKS
ncbi:MAG: T9SS type A sorting domain-containing protein [Bacteroidota bacterium]